MDRKALRRLTYGLYIVSSHKEGKINGQIANTVIQTTSRPTTIAVSINRENLTHEYISASRVFSVSILAQEAALKLIGTFGFRCGRDIDKFSECNYKIGSTKTPVVTESTLAYLEAKVIDQIELSTHTLFVGEVVDGEVLAEGEPMTYAYYHEVKGGKTPEKAATFIEEPEKEETKAELPRYVCSICGYVYDPGKGDSEGGIPPGTAFDNLPDDWICPICGASKDQFDRE